MSAALLREGGKYYQKCKRFLKRVSETFQRCLSLKRLSQNNDLHLNLVGKMKLPTPC